MEKRSGEKGVCVCMGGGGGWGREAAIDGVGIG